ncbi:MAG TPA: DNA-directed RNA polymerase subunit alpha C-terminal domain-containing protein [Coprothermobacter proteolyticus]|nr:DNA-directed RNA polymerase subunit alpha C-terminal domain-containing protein [Coprothermobacter proteolyticus]
MEKVFGIADLGRSVDRETGEVQRSAKLSALNLPEGEGITLGNALRRVLLGQIGGTGVLGFRLEGLDHEFMVLDGVVEDGLTIGLNLKKVLLRYYGEGVKVLYIKAKGPAEIKAGDIVPDADVEIFNPDQTILTVATDREIYMEIYVTNGVGYRTVEDNKKLYQFPFRTIYLDTSFSPVRRAEYHVTPAIVDEPGTFESLELIVYTNLAVDPVEVIRQAADFLSEEFKNVAESKEAVAAEEVPEEQTVSDEKLDASVEMLNLSRAVLTHLEKANINSIRDLVDVLERNESIPGIGAVRLEEIRNKLAAYLEGGTEDETQS